MRAGQVCKETTLRTGGTTVNKDTLQHAIQIVAKLSPQQKVELMTKFWDKDYDFEGQTIFYTNVINNDVTPKKDS
jgi:hypothetical protein